MLINILGSQTIPGYCKNLDAFRTDHYRRRMASRARTILLAVNNVRQVDIGAHIRKMA